MEIRATTGAKWYGAPAPYFCAPRSKLPAAPQWNYGAGWCDPSKPLNTTFDSVDSYLSYVKVCEWRVGQNVCVGGSQGAWMGVSRDRDFTSTCSKGEYLFDSKCPTFNMKQ